MKSFEEPVENNICVDYINGKAIFVTETSDIYFCEVPNGLIEIGEAANLSDLEPLSALPAEESDQITALLF